MAEEINDQVTATEKAVLLNENNENGGLNAKQIIDIENIKLKEWESIRNQYEKWLNKYTLIKIPFVKFLLILSILTSGYIFFNKIPQNYYQHFTIFAILIIIYCVHRLSKRQGELEGYYDGYSNGLSEGIKRVLNISEEDYIKLHKRAIDMKIDGHIADSIRRRSKKKDAPKIKE